MRQQQLQAAQRSEGAINPQAVTIEFNPIELKKSSRQLVTLPRWPLVGRSSNQNEKDAKSPGRPSILARLKAKLFGTSSKPKSPPYTRDPMGS
jgi:hypothetical protein